MRSIRYIFLILLVSGCSERLFIPAAYSPAAPKSVIGAVETGEIDVFLENIDLSGKHFVFDLEVVNNSDRAILVNPHMVYYYGGYEAFSLLAPGEEVHTSFAQAADNARGVHALKEKQVNDDIRATIRSQNALAIVLLVAATAVVVNDAVRDSQEYSKEIWTGADIRRSNARDVATFASLITLDMIQTGLEISQAKEFEDLEYLPEEYLHRRILKPGDRVRGKVFLPRRDVQYLRMVVPVENRDFIFDFRQATGSEMRLIRH